MPEPCTPSREHVRQVYADQHGDLMAEEHLLEFDRWLAAHDAEVRANELIAVAESFTLPALASKIRPWLRHRADAARQGTPGT